MKKISAAITPIELEKKIYNEGSRATNIMLIILSKNILFVFTMCLHDVYLGVVDDLLFSSPRDERRTKESIRKNVLSNGRVMEHAFKLLMTLYGAGVSARGVPFWVSFYRIS